MLRLFTRTPSTSTVVTLRHAHLTRYGTQMRQLAAVRTFATQQKITPELLRSHRLKAAAGIAPIDLSGEITVVDDKHAGEFKLEEEEKQASTGGRKKSARSSSSPDSDSTDPVVHLRSSRSLHPSESEDLTAPPKLPMSGTHRSHRPAEPTYEALQGKTPWKMTRVRNNEKQLNEDLRKELEQQEQQRKEYAERNPWPTVSSEGAQNNQTDRLNQPPAAGFETLKRGLPGQGWAQSFNATNNRTNTKTAPDATTEQEAATSPTTNNNPVWSDADFLLLFPHLRFVRSSNSNTSSSENDSDLTSTTSSSSSASPSSLLPSPTPRVEATPEQLNEIITNVRRKYPELEKLHLSTTWIKVRKWRELLGATRIGVDSETQTSGDASPTQQQQQQTPELPEGFPANALHPRYVQSDIFMTVDEVSSMLFRERSLLYLSIENAVVPRLQILRAHLPAINLAQVIQRNPSLLLSDLHVALPLKLRELRALFPEVNLVAFIEKDARILNHATSSYIIPRLNLIAKVTGYEPTHVIQFITVEYPQLLNMRWNRLKRIEVVREEGFWTWWKKEQQGAAAVSSTSSSTESNNNNPATLPFSIYADLIMMSSDTFTATFPFFTMSFTEAEQELLHHSKKGGNKKVSSTKQEPSKRTDEPSLGSLSPAILASVPGHPQSLSTALGQTSDSNLTQDEARAKRRMDYLAIKQAKADARSEKRSYMREREAEYQRKKMAEYSHKFQAIRARSESMPSIPQGDAPKARNEPWHARGPSTARPFGSNLDLDRNNTSSSSSGGSFNSFNSFNRTSNESDSHDTKNYRTDRPPSRSRSIERGTRDPVTGERNHGSTHQKNRAGSAMYSRHAAHSQGRVETFGGASNMNSNTYTPSSYTSSSPPPLTHGQQLDAARTRTSTSTRDPSVFSFDRRNSGNRSR